MGKRTFCLRVEVHHLLLFVSDWQLQWMYKRTLLATSACFPVGGGIRRERLEREGERRGLER